jgi:hypothetical protein
MKSLLRVRERGRKPAIMGVAATPSLDISAAVADRDCARL